MPVLTLVRDRSDHFGVEIWVVDDDQGVLNAVARVLRSAGYTVRAFSSAEEFLAEVETGKPGCAVLDLWMPGITGLDLQETLSRLHNPASVIFITAQADVSSSVLAMKHGAVDYLVKPFEASKLVMAVEAALERARIIGVARAERERVAQRFARLTPREREVLGELLRGRRNKQIAADLGAAEKTIKVHRARLQQKMEVHSLAELAGSIERAGLSGYLMQRPL